ncbi:MAG: ribonuclease HII [Halobacteriovoraceae bacterium]|jgi:ribonuclease HII|nr:ribonuclease HII [Halobacteriovoraceae bacterium]
MDKKLLVEFSQIIGCDEVGRGPIAGPVTACAVVVKKDSLGLIDYLHQLGVTDSKKLTERKRKNILAHLGIDFLNLELNQIYSKDIEGYCFQFCLFEHTPQQIDQMNILQASLSAMKNAAVGFENESSLILIDGNKVFDSKSQVQAVIKGDSKSVVIGMASVIAKVFRDEKMKYLDTVYPGYLLGKHAGYPTKEHKLAVKKLGPSPIHRKTFKGVKEFLC